MNDLIMNNIEWARNLAKRKKRNFPHIPLEELESAAFTGLVESAKKFPNSNAPFFSYASKRIRGEMDDYLRQCNMGWNRIRPVKVVGIEDMDFEFSVYDFDFYNKSFNIRIFRDKNLTKFNPSEIINELIEISNRLKSMYGLHLSEPVAEHGNAFHAFMTLKIEKDYRLLDKIECNSISLKFSQI